MTDSNFILDTGAEKLQKWKQQDIMNVIISIEIKVTVPLCVLVREQLIVGLSV